MTSATRLPRPRRDIALLVGLAVAVVLAGGARMTWSSEPSTDAAATSLATEIDAAGAEATNDAVGEQAQRHAPRHPLTIPFSVLVAVLALAAAVATGLRYTITSVPAAGRATSGLRPPPLAFC